MNETINKIKSKIKEQEIILDQLNEELEAEKIKLILELLEKCTFSIDKNRGTKYCVFLIPNLNDVFNKIEELCDSQDVPLEKGNYAIWLSKYFDGYCIEIQYGIRSKKFAEIVEKFNLKILNLNDVL